MFSLHANADNFNMQDVKDRFEQNPSYVALPREYQMYMHLPFGSGSKLRVLRMRKAFWLKRWSWQSGRCRWVSHRP